MLSLLPLGLRRLFLVSTTRFSLFPQGPLFHSGALSEGRERVHFDKVYFIFTCSPDFPPIPFLDHRLLKCTNIHGLNLVESKQEFITRKTTSLTEWRNRNLLIGHTMKLMSYSHRPRYLSVLWMHTAFLRTVHKATLHQEQAPTAGSPPLSVNMLHSPMRPDAEQPTGRGEFTSKSETELANYLPSHLGQAGSSNFLFPLLS